MTIGNRIIYKATLILGLALLLQGCAQLRAIEQAGYTASAPQWRAFFEQMEGFQDTIEQSAPNFVGYLSLLSNERAFIATALENDSLFQAQGNYSPPRVPAAMVMQTRFRYFALTSSLRDYQRAVCEHELQSLLASTQRPINSTAQWLNYQRSMTTRAAEMEASLLATPELPGMPLCVEEPFRAKINAAISEHAQHTDNQLAQSLKSRTPALRDREYLEEIHALGQLLQQVNPNASEVLRLSELALRVIEKKTEIARNTQQFESAMADCRAARPKPRARETFWDEKFIHSYLGMVVIVEPLDRFYCRGLQSGQNIESIRFSSGGKIATVTVSDPDDQDRKTFKLGWNNEHRAWTLQSWVLPQDSPRMSLVKEFEILKRLFNPPEI